MPHITNQQLQWFHSNVSCSPSFPLTLHFFLSISSFLLVFGHSTVRTLLYWFRCYFYFYLFFSQLWFGVCFLAFTAMSNDWVYLLRYGKIRVTCADDYRLRGYIFFFCSCSLIVTSIFLVFFFYPIFFLFCCVYMCMYISSFFIIIISYLYWSKPKNDSSEDCLPVWCFRCFSSFVCCCCFFLPFCFSFSFRLPFTLYLRFVFISVIRFSKYNYTVESINFFSVSGYSGWSLWNIKCGMYEYVYAFTHMCMYVYNINGCCHSFKLVSFTSDSPLDECFQISVRFARKCIVFIRFLFSFIHSIVKVWLCRFSLFIFFMLFECVSNLLCKFVREYLKWKSAFHLWIELIIVL